MSSQDLGGIGMDDSFEFGGMDQDISFGDFGEEGLPLEIEPAMAAVSGYGVVPPSPAISELAPIEMELEAFQVPRPAKRQKKRPRAYVPIIDEAPEMSGKNTFYGAG